MRGAVPCPGRPNPNPKGLATRWDFLTSRPRTTMRPGGTAAWWLLEVVAVPEITTPPAPTPRGWCLEGRPVVDAVLAALLHGRRRRGARPPGTRSHTHTHTHNCTALHHRRPPGGWSDPATQPRTHTRSALQYPKRASDRPTEGGCQLQRGGRVSVRE
jgi:hypothetical protein